MYKSKLLLAFFAVGILAACPPLPAPKAEYGYHDNVGPEDWCGLSAGFALCCDGMAQSPVDIVPAEIVPSENLKRLRTSYAPCGIVKAVHNGHTIQANLPLDYPWEKAGIRIGKRKYKLQQFHFHTPSEHTINGKHRPIEMHMVHKTENGLHAAVIGVMIVPGKHNKQLAKIWRDLPQAEGDQTMAMGIRLGKLLPKNRQHVRYAGSLTTPPCSEGISWFVMKEPIKMSKAQIKKFRDLFSGEEFPHGNARPVQALNGREILTRVPPQN